MYGAPVSLKEFDLSYVEHNIVLSQLILTWLNYWILNTKYIILYYFLKTDLHVCILFYNPNQTNQIS